MRPAEFVETHFWRVLERLQNLDPSFAIVDTAGEHDNKRAREVCAGIATAEIVVFDKAFVDFDPLADLDARGVWSVTRAKDKMSLPLDRPGSFGSSLFGAENRNKWAFRVRAHIFEGNRGATAHEMMEGSIFPTHGNRTEAGTAHATENLNSWTL